jgi:hypothetical protein
MGLTIKTNRAEAFLVIAWICMQAFLIYTYGIVTGNEAGKYIGQAELLIQTGNVSHPTMWFYSTEIFLIAASKFIGTGYVLVLILQLIFNAIAMVLFYRLAMKFASPVAAFLITLLLILNYSFQAFNTFLYTESLFFSFTIIFTYYLLTLERLTLQRIIAITLLLLLICFTRPSGFLLVPAVLIYIFFRFLSAWSLPVKLGGFLLLVCLFLFLLNAVIGSGGELDFMLPFREEHIICGMPAVISNGKTDPADNSIFGLLSFAAEHPGDFIRLALQRSLAFFGLTRSYYSTGHNIYLALYFFPVYLLILFSLSHWWKNNKLVLIFCLAVIIATWISVIFTCDDWHNRFYLSILPFLYLLAIPAIDKLASFFKKTIR